jgi:putative pyruvate formate lyase activating enzyme
VVEALAQELNRSGETRMQTAPVHQHRGDLAWETAFSEFSSALQTPATFAISPGVGPGTVSRSALAHLRAQVAHALLSDCHLCAHHCGVNRVAGELGKCHAGVGTRYHLAQTEVSDEPDLAPCFAIGLSGCDLRCDFCISGAESWNPQAGARLNASRLAHQASVALASGARSIMILGGEPTVHLPAALELVAHLPDTAMLVWKTNAHGTAQARSLLAGLFDVWVADYKFGNDACADRLAHVPNYTAVVRENLCWAAVHTHLIVRHLVMPGHVECCWKPVASWLARELPGATVSLRGGFWPGWHSSRHPELHRTASHQELERAKSIAMDLGLSCCS